MRGRKRTVLRAWLGALLLLTAGGCVWETGTMLYVRDEVCAPGETVKLTAKLEENDWRWEDIKKKPISFWLVDADGEYEHLGGAVTDKEGCGSAAFHPPGPGEYIIECEFAGASGLKPVSYRANVFCKQVRRYGIILDFDKTLAATSVKDVFAGQFRLAPPLDSDTVRVVNALAKEYELFIVTSRPRTQAGAIMEWLSRNGFPRAPTFLYDPRTEAIRPAAAKRKVFQEIRRVYPLVVLGIGDRESDLQSCIHSGMLAIGIGRNERGVFGVRSWRDVEALLLGEPDPQLAPPQLIVEHGKGEMKFWLSHKEAGWALEYSMNSGDFHSLPPAPWAEQLKKIFQRVAAPSD